jgi:hypothetical protein
MLVGAGVPSGHGDRGVVAVVVLGSADVEYSGLSSIKKSSSLSALSQSLGIFSISRSLNV